MSGQKNPFVGLRPFEAGDSLYYFGRGEQTRELLTGLHRTRFVAVVGSSGCGKSSLVRAGLIPNLEAGFLVQDRDRWHIAKMKPGDRPFYNLAHALLRAVGDGAAADMTALAEATATGGTRALVERFGPVLEAEDSNLFLLVDQFEEVFRFGLKSGDSAKREEASDFVDLLLGLAAQVEVPVYVCLTMRSDYIGDCDAFHGLPEAMNRGQYLVPRLTRPQRRQVIEGPIRLSGAAVTPRLVDRLLNESGEFRDDLPVLQHALMRTWGQWKKRGAGADGPMDTGHYEAIQTMKQALSRHADEALEELSPEEQRVAKTLFQLLTETDAENRRIRRSAYLNDIAAVTGASPETLMGIIDKFQRDGRAFLVLSPEKAEDNPLVDISHESLMRQWGTLGQWMDEEAESADIYRRLADAAQLHKRRKGGLYTDPALQIALEWREKEAPTPVWAERYHKDFDGTMTFLEESRSACDEKIREEKRQRQKTLRLNRLVMLAISVALTLLIRESCLKVKREEEANRQNKKGVREELFESKEISNFVKKFYKSQLGKNKELEEAIKNKKDANYKLAGIFDEMSMKALEYGENEDVWLYMAAALRQEIGSQRLHLRPKSAGELLITGDVNAAFQERWVPRATIAHSDKVTAVTFIPDDHTIASVSANMTIRLWDRGRRLQKEIAPLTGNSKWVNCVALSPDGKTIAFGSNDKTIRLWNRDSQKETATLTGSTDAVTCVAFSLNGKTIVSGSRDQYIRLWDSAAKKEIAVLAGHRGPVTCVAFNPDGKTIASSFDDKTIRLLDKDSQKEIATLIGHTDIVRCVAFSPDGKTVASGSVDKTIRLWDRDSQKEIATLTGHSDDVNGVAFSPDGQTIASGSNDNTIQLWDLRIFNLFLKGGKPTPLFFTFAEGVEFFRGVKLEGFEYKYVYRSSHFDKKFLPLLDEPAPGQTKFEQILQWAEKQMEEKR